jgi:hypothetical protein
MPTTCFLNEWHRGEVQLGREFARDLEDLDEVCNALQGRV